MRECIAFTACFAICGIMLVFSGLRCICASSCHATAASHLPQNPPTPLICLYGFLKHQIRIHRQIRSRQGFFGAALHLRFFLPSLRSGAKKRLLQSFSEAAVLIFQDCFLVTILIRVLPFESYSLPVSVKPAFK